MAKLLGACLVGLASLMAGWASRQTMQHHVRLLRQLRLGLELMQGEMEVRMPPVSELFETVGRQVGGTLGAFLTETASEMEAVTGRPPLTAMRLVLERLPMEKDASDLLLELAGCLGRYDLEGQTRAIGLCKQRADRLIVAAEEMLHRRARSSMTASVCAGLALVILLL